MRPARLAIAAAAIGVIVLVVIGLTQLGGSSASSGPNLSAAQIRARLAGSAPALTAVHAQADDLLGGGLPALRARLGALRGLPVVVNKWASWCVAFVGIDSGDTSAADARSFLHSHPVTYPSYYDADGQAGLAITDSSFTPVTVFFDRSGSEYIHQGPYPSAAKLERDIRRYALDG
jgi:cytochrome c biogenesis protein CcmG/thiol:disulfide interchange protein DsbE